MSDLASRKATAPTGHEMPIDGEAHEDIKSLYRHWCGMAPAGGLPGRQHFDPMEIPHLLPNVWLIDVHRDPMRFWRRLVGSRIEEFAGRSLVNGWVADGMDDENRQLGVHKNLADVVMTGQPSWRRGKPMIRYEKGYSELERIYLPLAQDGETVDMILAMSLFYELTMPEAEPIQAPITAQQSPAFV